MSKPYLTEQERIDSVTLKIDDPSRIVGSGYIQFPPQVPFSQPLTRQPPTITVSQFPRSSPRATDGRSQRQRQPGGQSSQPSSYQQRAPQQSYRQQETYQSRPPGAGSYSAPQARQPHGEQGSRGGRRPQQNGRMQQNGGPQQNGYTSSARDRGSAAPTSHVPPPAASSGSAAQPSSRHTNGSAAAQPNGQRSVPASTPRIASGPPGLESAIGKLSLEEKAVQEEPLSKAQAKRLRKKLREGRAEL